jgi:3-methyl-2-oxobutanoate hydroxymethyltransferase|tara:strand:+ start:6979 stop:7794 length:816 start_codon:yes stop_codon:yes gene_type:complete
MSSQNNIPLTTISSLNKLKEKSEKFTCLTAYESTMASIISNAGVDVILVGDSLGMVVQGHDSTLPVTMDQLIYHLECVVKGNKTSHIMADMPFMSYATDDLGFENATRLMQSGAHSIKIEGGEWICNMANTLAERGIPVCAHIGLTPQAINRIGGYFVQGRDTDKHDLMIAEAKALENAGAAMLLLECVPDQLAETITNELQIPVIGIGAGAKTDGQIMVIHDLLGISCLDKPPKFVKDFMQDANSIEEAIKLYVDSVKTGTFPATEHTFY